MTQPDTSDRTAKLAVIREIRILIEQSVVGINWLSDELQTSPTERGSRRHGPGEEERGIKPYELGDNIKHIHLAATAASSDPDLILIRTFFQSRVVRFNALVDVGLSMHFGTHNTLKSRLAAACAGAGLGSAIAAQDIPSYVTFGNRPLTIRVEDSSSDLLFEALTHFVQDAERSKDRPKGGGLAEAFEPIRYLDRSVNLVVSDFAYMSDADWQALRLMGIEHDTVAAFIQDPRERELPDFPFPGAAYEFEDCQGTVKSIWVAANSVPDWMRPVIDKLAFGKALTTRADYAANFKRHEDEIIARLKKCGIKTVVVSTDRAKDDVRKLLRMLASQTR